LGSGSSGRYIYWFENPTCRGASTIFNTYYFSFSAAGLLVTLSSPKGRFARLEREGVAWAGGPSFLVD